MAYANSSAAAALLVLFAGSVPAPAQPEGNVSSSTVDRPKVAEAREQGGEAAAVGIPGTPLVLSVRVLPARVVLGDSVEVTCEVRNPPSGSREAGQIADGS